MKRNKEQIELCKCCDEYLTCQELCSEALKSEGHYDPKYRVKDKDYISKGTFSPCKATGKTTRKMCKVYGCRKPIYRDNLCHEHYAEHTAYSEKQIHNSLIKKTRSNESTRDDWDY